MKRALKGEIHGLFLAFLNMFYVYDWLCYYEKVVHIFQLSTAYFCYSI